MCEDLDEISFSELLKMNFTKIEKRRNIPNRKSNSSISAVNKKIKKSEIADKTTYILSNISSILQDSLYNCPKCNTSCFNKFNHLLEYHQNDAVECSYCYELIHVKDLKIHINKCENAINCSSKNEYIDSNRSPEILSQNKFLCEFCSMTLATKNSLNKHLEMSGGIWKCFDCKQIFPSYDCADSHSQISHPESSNREPRKFDSRITSLTLAQLHCYNVVKKLLKGNHSVQDKIRNDDTNNFPPRDQNNKTVIDPALQNTNKSDTPKKLMESTSVGNVKELQISSHNETRNQDMKVMAQQFLTEKEYLLGSEFDSVAKIIEHSEISNMLNCENEQFLQNVFSNTPQTDDISDTENCMGNTESGVRLIDVLRSSVEDPQAIPIIPGEDLIVLATERRRVIENEKKRQEKIEQEKRKEERQITFQKLLILDKIESNISQLIQEYDSDSSEMTSEVELHDEDLSFIEQNHLSEDEINDILMINSNRDSDKLNIIFSKVTLLEYSIPDHLINKTTAAQYDCHICGQFYTKSFNDFYVHLLNHNNKMILKKPLEGRRQCIICDKFISTKEFYNHFKIHKTDVRCFICNDFVNENKLEIHVSSHNKHYKCQICGEICKTIGAIRKHTSHHFTGFVYSCEICQASFAGLEKLICHVSQEHRNIDPTSPECIYCFNLTNNIKNHIYSLGLCKLKCKICRKVFKTDSDLTVHIKKHKKIQKPALNKREHTIFVCEQCHLTLPDFSKSLSHVNCHNIDALYIKHVSKISRAECSICQLQMPSSRLFYHMKKHDYYDRCTKCFEFVKKESFGQHILSHDTDLKCNTCDVTFVSKRQLENHEYAHGRLMQRACGECHLVFNSEVARVAHLSLVHRRVDPEFVECNFCKEMLAIGIEAHLHEFSCCQCRCKLCDKRFKHDDDYRNHVNEEHADLVATSI